MLLTWLGETLNAMRSKTTIPSGDDSGSSGSPRGDGILGDANTRQSPQTTRAQASLYLYMSIFEDDSPATSEQPEDH